MLRPQFSIKTLLWLMLLTAIGCVVIPPAVRAYAEYRERHKFDDLIQLIRETVHGPFSEIVDPNDVGEPNDEQPATQE